MKSKDHNIFNRVTAIFISVLSAASISCAAVQAAAAEEPEDPAKNGLFFRSLGYTKRMYLYENGSPKSLYNGFAGISGKGKRYYESGRRIYGWYKIGNDWYHFDPSDGLMSTGSVNICGTTYIFDENGKWTGKCGKSGFAPEDFSVKIYEEATGMGFDTSESTVCYGMTEDGNAFGQAYFSNRDKQVLYCMFLESGFETGSSACFDEDYIISSMKKASDDSELEYELTIPATIYNIEITLNGKTAEVSYNFDAEQFIFSDKAVFNGNLLCRGCCDYMVTVIKKYPFKDEDKLILLE